MTVKAIATITVEITCNSVWSNATTMEQIIKQAKDDAEGVIRRLQEKESSLRLFGQTPITIKAVSVLEEK